MVKNVLVKTEVQDGNRPVMVSCNVDMTPEEEAEMKRINAEISNTPTPEERLTIIEDAFAELCEVIFNG